MERLLLAMLGGALGTGARYLVGAWAAAKLPGEFPYGTLIVNVVGSFVMGVVAQAATTNPSITPNARAFIAVGLLGGFTTYSAFNQEALAFVDHRAFGTAAFYMGLTVVTCLIAGSSGIFVARWVIGT